MCKSIKQICNYGTQCFWLYSFCDVQIKVTKMLYAWSSGSGVLAEGRVGRQRAFGQALHLATWWRAVRRTRPGSSRATRGPRLGGPSSRRPPRLLVMGALKFAPPETVLVAHLA
jgi:hypothetical protein